MYSTSLFKLPASMNIAGIIVTNRVQNIFYLL